jgi:hypothetical protein
MYGWISHGVWVGAEYDEGKTHMTVRACEAATKPTEAAAASLRYLRLRRVG